MDFQKDFDFLNFIESKREKQSKVNSKIRKKKKKKKSGKTSQEKEEKKSEAKTQIISKPIQNYDFPAELSQSFIKKSKKQANVPKLYMGIDQNQEEKVRKKYQKLLAQRSIEDRFFDKMTPYESEEFRTHHLTNQVFQFPPEFRRLSFSPEQNNRIPQTMGSNQFSTRRYLDFEDPEIHQPIYLNKFNQETRVPDELEIIGVNRRRRKKKMVTTYKQDKFRANQKSIQRVGIDLSEFVKDARRDRVYVLRRRVDDSFEDGADGHFSNNFRAISVDEDANFDSKSTTYMNK